MTPTPGNAINRLDELLADRAAQGLSPHEAAELDTLLRASSGDDDSLDLAAAAMHLAFLGDKLEPMPQAMQQKLAGIGETWAAVQSRGGSPRPEASRWKFAAWSGWMAAAAAVLLAVAGWWGRAGAPAPADAMRALKARATDVQTLAWAAGPTEAPAGATGEVVWSPSRQEGYMVFRNVKPNDPSKEQYQLWIFDSKRDAKYPVDGGVFDISSTGECIIPIRPGVHVDDATLFAITIERPGGVVVSDRTRLPLLAKVAEGG